MPFRNHISCPPELSDLASGLKRVAALFFGRECTILRQRLVKDFHHSLRLVGLHTLAFARCQNYSAHIFILGIYAFCKCGIIIERHKHIFSVQLLCQNDILISGDFLIKITAKAQCIKINHKKQQQKTKIHCATADILQTHNHIMTFLHGFCKCNFVF